MKNIFLFLVLFIMSAKSDAQKIKYKDLFFVLDTKNYEDGEPLLRTFLSDTKNSDHANGNFQLALIFEKKVLDSDVVIEPEKLIGYADSALIYYGNALKYIDEKEVKKNDEYYQAYQRRDIRTGKFGIKLADITFDIEKKIEEVEDRKANVQELQVYFTQTKSNFDKALSVYKGIKDKYPTKKMLYLRSGTSLFDELDVLTRSSKLALQNYESFESTLKKINESGYSPTLHVTEILDYEKDGLTNIILTNDNIYFWDYASWSSSIKEGIEKVVVPMRTELVEYDRSLDLLFKRIQTDSMAMDDKIVPLNSLLIKLKEYDDDPFPQHLFNYKIAKINLESYKMNHLLYRDSSDFIYQKEVAQNKYEKIIKMDSLLTILENRNGVEDENNYAQFIKTQYENSDGVTAYIKTQQEGNSYAKKNSILEIEQLSERAKWLVGENDSIPLFEEVNIGLSKYAPLVQSEDFTAGLYFSGKSAAEGYFATIDNTFVQKKKVNFAVDNEYFKKQNFDFINTLNVKGESGTYYYILLHYHLPDQEEYAGTIAKIHSDNGLAWAKNIILQTEPSRLLINTNTEDLIIEYNIEGYMGAADLPDRLVLTSKGEEK